MWYTNRIKDRNYVIISSGISGKFNIPFFMIKTPKKLEIDGIYCSMTRAKGCGKPMANIILNGDKTVIIFSKIWKRTKVCTISFLIQYRA